jgi:dTDP-glucose 4,6-dehydratase
MDLQDTYSIDRDSLSAILVTGGAGFIGSNFVRLLLNSRKYKVINLDILSYAGNIESISNILDHPNHTFIQGNICNRELVSKLLAQHQPIALINFAAESHVDRSIDDANPFIQSNIVGVYELLEASRKYLASLPQEKQSKFRFLQISTDEVYGELEETGYFSELSNYQPSSPYSASKAAADHLVHAYHRTYGLPTLITNCSNNYGPYQYPEKLIPVIISNALNGNSIPIYGDGKNIRDWLFVEDHCNGILTALEKGKVGEKYCIGGNSEKTNIEIAMTICTLLDEIHPTSTRRKYSEQIEYVDDRAGHDRRYAINFDKIHKELNWSPKENFNSGIKKTVQWYLDNQIWCSTILNTSSSISSLTQQV